MPYKLQPPASFSRYHPELSQQANAQLQAELLADFAKMCRCSECKKRGGLFYEECCSRILCEGCHRESRCNGQNTEQAQPAKQQRELAPVQIGLFD